MPDLRAVLIVDYQNVHLMAHELFAVSKDRPRHESLVDPLHFGNQLIMSRNHAQKARWERDKRVTVTYRP